MDSSGVTFHRGTQSKTANRLLKSRVGPYRGESKHRFLRRYLLKDTLASYLDLKILTSAPSERCRKILHDISNVVGGQPKFLDIALKR